jgi:hypothetical protein
VVVTGFRGWPLQHRGRIGGEGEAPVYSRGNSVRGGLAVNGGGRRCLWAFSSEQRRPLVVRGGQKARAECWGGCGVLLWMRFHMEMDGGGGGSPGNLYQSGERKEREWGADSVQPSRGKKGGPMPRTLEQGEGPGAGMRWSGRQGRAHGGGCLVWRMGQPDKRKEIGPKKEMGPALEE